MPRPVRTARRTSTSKEARYTLRTNLDEPDKSGTQDGKKYDIKRHHGTLVISLPATTAG